MNIAEYLNPQGCPDPRPDVASMAESTRALHRSIDEAIRRCGIPFLHPQGPSLQLDLLGSARMTAWQEGKAGMVLEGNGCWSSLPQVYARYGVEATRTLIEEVQALEGARAAILAESGMQACALLFDVLLERGTHAVLCRQVYNKTRKYLEWLAGRIGAAFSIVDDGDYAGIEAAVRENTRLVFAETFTNPLLRAVDPPRLGDIAARLRGTRSPGLRLVIDDTIASPWSFKKPLLEHVGVDFVVASGTKSLAGQDRDLWGYIASNRLDSMNEIMDLEAMRGGILDWRRAHAILEGLPAARTNFERRSRTAAQVASFLASHPRVSEVFHPSPPLHPYRKAIDGSYRLCGSLLSFRLAGAGEEEARHFADVLATCVVPRYALSFDGLTTKVNHHRTVSEYFTPVEELERAGIDRLVRLGVGIEEPSDVIACLNWALWRHDRISPAEVARWQEARARELGVYEGGRRA